MAGNIRDGTGRYCFDMFDGKESEDGTGRDGKIMKILLAWMGRDRTVGVHFLDGTERDGTAEQRPFCFLTGRDGK